MGGSFSPSHSSGERAWGQVKAITRLQQLYLCASPIGGEYDSCLEFSNSKALISWAPAACGLPLDKLILPVRSQSVWNWMCLHVHRPRRTADDLITVNNLEPISFKRIRNQSKLVFGRVIQLAVVRSGLGGHRLSLIYHTLLYS